MNTNEQYQELGKFLIDIVEYWKANHRENSLVDSYGMAMEILNSGIIGDYLEKKHSKPYGT